MYSIWNFPKDEDHKGWNITKGQMTKNSIEQQKVCNKFKCLKRSNVEIGEMRQKDTCERK